MKPKLFRFSDLRFMIIAAAVGIAPPIVAHLSHNHADTWGEVVSFPGWLMAWGVFAVVFAIVVTFYWKRRQWLQLYRYTTTHGILCFYEPGARVYLQHEVERETTALLDRWVQYYNSKDHSGSQDISAGVYIRKSICIFKAEHHWREVTGFGRLVRGLAGWNWCQVGQGGDRIAKTAFSHEIAHIHLNRMERMMVPESEAHKLFSEAGIP